MQVKNLNKSLLALAFSAAGLVFAGSAMACTTDNWDGGATGSPVAGNPSADVKRYAGECGLRAATAGSSFVSDTSPAGETHYRARFYFYTGSTSASPVVFEAKDDAAAPVVQAVYNGGAGTVSFNVSGVTVTPVAVQANKWYGVEFYYQASGPFAAWIKGGAASAETQFVTSGNAGALTIQDASLGVVNAAAATNDAGRLNFDAFESTRSQSTRIGFICRGDANGSGGVTGTDRTAVSLELALPPVYGAGQVDCNEDGRITASDRFCVTEKLDIFDPAQQCL